MTWAPSPRLKDAALVAGAAAASFALEAYGFLLASGTEGIVPFRAANGLLLAVLLLARPGLRAPLYAAGFSAPLFAGLVEGRSLLLSLGLSGSHLLELFLAFRAALSLPRRERFFESLKGTVAFFGLVTVLCPALAALASAAWSHAAAGIPFRQAWAVDFMSGAVGLAFTTPFLLGWILPEQGPRRSAAYRWEFAAVMLLVVGVAIVVFGDWVRSRLLLPHGSRFPVFPIVTWCALRYRSRGSTSSLLILFAAATWFTSRGQGAFVGSGSASPSQVLLTLQILSYTLLACALLPSAVVHEHHRAVERYRRSERRFDVLENGGVVGIIIARGNGDVIEANQRFLDMVGYSREDLEAGRINTRALTPEDQSGQFEEIRRAYAATGRIAPQERDYIRKDGTRIHTYLSGARLDEEGLGLALIHDITELKRTREAYKQAQKDTEAARKAAEEANLAKGQFLAAMSHEIRTPLNGILGMTSLLLDTPLRPEQKSFAATIRSSGEHLLTLVNQVLDFSKIEDGKVEIERTEFRLEAVLEGAQQFVLERSQSKGLELATRIDPEARRRYLGDPMRIQQVLLNLLSNAVKFTEQGSILVSAEVEEAGGTAHRIRFAVVDQGPGIPEADRERIFEPFRQGQTGSNRRAGGTGLGLAICRDLVRRMGGRIWVESARGRGSAFQFTLDLDLAQDSAPAPPFDAAPRNGIALIWEPNFHARLQLKEMMAAWGVESEFLAELGQVEWIAKSARLRNPSASPFAILAANPGDPDQGEAVVRALTQSAGKGTPLFVSLPFIAQSQGLAYLHAGAAGLLTKPFRAAQLRETLGGILPGLFREPEAGNLGDDPAAIPSLQWRRAPRILVVDDHPVNLEVAASMLARLGCVPDAVEDGPQALILLRWKAYDLVLMDCEMPGMDGFEACRLIREGEQGREHIPIVALTAHAVAGARERCLAAGMDDYLAKPFSAQQLANTLARWIPEGAEASAAPLEPRAPAGRHPVARNGDGTRNGDGAAGADGDGPVDWSRLAALGDGADDRERIRHLISLFLRTTRTSLESLQSLRAEPDLQGARKTLHRLKGSCATLGARRMAELIQEMERTAEAGEAGRLGSMLGDLEEAFGLTSRLLEERAG